MNPIDRTALWAGKIRELIDASFASRYDDLVATLRNSMAAVALLNETHCELPVELVVAAWTQYGNALRLTGRYAEAERALARAGAFPVSDLPTRIHLLEVTASLYRVTGRYGSAKDLLVSGLAAQQSLADPAGLAQIYNQLGLVHSDAGDRHQAFRAFQTALNFLGPGSPPGILATTGHNLFHALIAAGKLETASVALVSLEPLYRRLTSTRLLAKADWMRARLCRALKQRSAARLAYERAYELLSTEPCSPELPVLAEEMGALPACWAFKGSS
ncbi:MAG TPA: hypothetical protein VEW48_03520 [Thermoanaerobaculia bacterium]|nr:hypothetical protein [Thermoanaerobaculia bacterium]